MNLSDEQVKEMDFLQSLIQKAWDSETFKNELVSDPQSAIELVTGKPMHIPAGKSLVVTDQTDVNAVYINIPAKIDQSDFELSEEQLEAVAGGIAEPYNGWNPFIWVGIGAHHVYNWATS